MPHRNVKFFDTCRLEAMFGLHVHRSRVNAVLGIRHPIFQRDPLDLNPPHSRESRSSNSSIRPATPQRKRCFDVTPMTRYPASHTSKYGYPHEDHSGHLRRAVSKRESPGPAKPNDLAGVGGGGTSAGVATKRIAAHAISAARCQRRRRAMPRPGRQPVARPGQ